VLGNQRFTPSENKPKLSGRKGQDRVQGEGKKSRAECFQRNWPVSSVLRGGKDPKKNSEKIEGVWERNKTPWARAGSRNQWFHKRKSSKSTRKAGGRDKEGGRQLG